jgi:parvulin-like peptidyl-prolyl isomerase
MEIHRLAQNRWYEPLVGYMLDDIFAKRLEIPDSSIDSFYQANLEAYTTPERRRATHILISTNAKAWQADGIDVSGLSQAQLKAKAKERIDELYREVKAGADLGELAGKYSHDSQSKAKNGDLGYFGRGQMVPKFEDVVFRMKKGEISKPFETRFGYHIVRLDDVLDETVAPLSDSLRNQIREGLKAVRRRGLGLAFIDSLRNNAEYVWNEDLLKKNIGEYKDRDWVCIVNGTDTIDGVILEQRELRYRTGKRVSDITPEERKELVMAEVNPYILFSAARKLGYAETDTMQQVYQQMRRLEVTNRIYNDRTRLDWTPSEEEMREYYDDHKDLYQSDTPVKVKHIVFKDSATAEQVLAEINAGADFDSLAMKYYPGDDDIKEIAYDLGWITEDEMGPDFFRAAWLTTPGKVTGPVHTQWGYHLIKVIDKRPKLKFEQARLDIKRRMLDEKRDEIERNWVKWLTDGKHIEVFDDILDQVDLTKQDYYKSVADSLEQAATAAGVS